VVATSTRPYRLVVDGGIIYWTDYDAGTVNRVPAGGGATTTIYPGPGRATDLAVAGGYVFFSNGADLLRIPTGGGTSLVLANAEVTNISFVKADATYAWYMTNYNIVRRVPIGGGALSTVSSGPYNSNIIDLAFSDGGLYWTNDGIWNDDYRSKMPGTAGIYEKMPTASAGSEFIDDLGYPLYRIAVDASYIYWLSSGSLHRVPRDRYMATVTNLSGGPSNNSQVQAMISDGTNLYWVTASGTTGHLYRMPAGGGTVTDLAAGDAATSLAQDATNVYWISGTSIVRQAK
jgi:hypothetical protein